jgi:hypothetical protein
MDVGMDQSVQYLDHRLDNQSIKVELLTQARDFPFLHSIQTVYGAHPASHSMGIGSYMPGGKVARA